MKWYLHLTNSTLRTTGWDSKLHWDILKNPIEAVKNIKNVYVARHGGSFMLLIPELERGLWKFEDRLVYTVLDQLGIHSNTLSQNQQTNTQQIKKILETN